MALQQDLHPALSGRVIVDLPPIANVNAGMSCAILNQLAPPSRLYWIIRWSLCFKLVLSHLISWTLPINQTSPPFGWMMVSGGGYCPQYLPPVFKVASNL